MNLKKVGKLLTFNYYNYFYNKIIQIENKYKSICIQNYKLFNVQIYYKLISIYINNNKL